MATTSRGYEQIRVKLHAAQRALELVESGMAVGLGSRSTAMLWIKLPGERGRDHGLKIRAVARSEDGEHLGRSYGVPLGSFLHAKPTVWGAFTGQWETILPSVGAQGRP